jgi:hypothetical protein
VIGDVVKLTTNEKEILEELFQMRGGCVLNFSDRTFGSSSRTTWPSISLILPNCPRSAKRPASAFKWGDEGYPLITPQNAAAAVERNALKRGRW